LVARDPPEQQQQRQQGALTLPSLEDYRLLVESIVDYGVFLLDPTGHIASWNRGAERIKGYAAHEIVGRHFSTFYPPEDVEAGKPEMELEVAKAEGRLEDEGWRIRKDGSRFWANVVITALRDASGELRGFAKVTRDLTQRRAAEEELRRSEERFRLLVEGVGDYAIYMLDPTGRVTTWNSGAQQLKGYSHDEIVGKHFEVFFTPEQREAGAPARELEIARTTGRFEEEGWRVTKDGTRFWANVVVTAIHSAKGELLGYAKVTRDLTAKRNAEITARDLIREQAARAAAEEAEVHIRFERERYRALSRRFEVIFEAVGDGILVQDRTGKVIFANSAAAVLSGLSSGTELVDVEAAALLDRFEMLDEVGNVVPAQGMPGRKVMVGPERNATARLRIRNRHTGRESWNVVRASAVPGEDGQPELVVILWHDVTSEHRREERERYLARATGALASSLDHEAMLSTLAGLLVPGLADWCSIQLLEESEGGELQLRPVAVAHADPAKLAQAADYQRRYPPDREHTRGVWNVVRTGVSELYEDVTPELVAAAAKDAEHLELLRGVGMRSLIAVPIRVRDRVSGAMTLVSTAPGRRYEREDVVLAEELGRRVGAAIDNAKLFEQAQAAVARAEEASRVKDEFLATVSHELRTPLNAVLGWASMLDGTVEDAKLSKGIAVIHRNARAQAKIIEDILDVSRIITGKLRLELQSVDLAKIVRDAMEVVRPSADAKMIATVLQAPPEPCMLVADPERLQQVVWNLLSNAVKFTDAEGTVTATVSCDGPRVTLEVTDTGRGIAPKFLPLVFERFKQADGTTTRRVGGLGLGLAIVRHIVELHGGHVRAASDGPGRGATFTVTLPVRAVRAERQDAAGSVRPATQALGPQPSSLRGVRVLVVDDEPDARDLVFTVLELAGATVETAASAAEALAMLRRAPPDVLVSDLGMPDEDGFELMRQVRALDPVRGGTVPAIALSAYTRGEDKTRAAVAGFDFHVSKPVSADDLVAAIARLVKGGGAS
jgi:PAS domain S-box-containing protein